MCREVGLYEVDRCNMYRRYFGTNTVIHVITLWGVLRSRTAVHDKTVSRDVLRKKLNCICAFEYMKWRISWVLTQHEFALWQKRVWRVDQIWRWGKTYWLSLFRRWLLLIQTSGAGRKYYRGEGTAICSVNKRSCTCWRREVNLRSLQLMWGSLLREHYEEGAALWLVQAMSFVTVESGYV